MALKTNSSTVKATHNIATLTNGNFNKEKAMKRKTIAKERNRFVSLALFRKAGVHRKSNKALRRAQKQIPLGV